MSELELGTVREQDAYDKGFADAKEYWVPRATDRIRRQLIEDAVISTNMPLVLLERVLEIVGDSE